MKVPFLDLGAAHAELRDPLGAAFARVVASGRFILGEEVDAFEAEFASYCSAAYAVGVANGLDALQLALRALGVGPGDEVVVPSNTFIASWLAVTLVGATPVPVEPCEASFNLDAEGIELALTPRTRAIMPVHLYGRPADLDPILRLARSRGIAVLEDAAQAHGARYRGERIGSHSDLVAWSFYPGKNLGALGDGGAVTTNDAALAERIRLLRNYGSRAKYVHECVGMNSRLDALQAALLRAKLGSLDEWNARRLRVARHYAERLAGTKLCLPSEATDAESSWHLYVVRTPHRDALQRHLAAAGVETLIHYPLPPHAQTAYAGAGFGPDAFPLAARMAREVLSLPIGPHLAPSQVDHVCNAVLDWQRRDAA
jgi:dTDP-4-amino-4,6-dideoxygalactose transaminase